jgi:hypothetical protein
MGTPWGLIAEGGSHLAQNIGASGGSILDYAGEKKRLNRYADSVDRQKVMNQEMYDDISGMYDPYSQAGLEALEQLRTGNFDYTPAEFDQSSVQQWLDPNVNYQMDQANRALTARQAGSGDYLSGAGAREITEQNRQMAQSAYQPAQQMAYGDYLNRIGIDRQNIADRYNRLQNLNQQGMQATGAQAGARLGQGQGAMALDQNATEIRGQQSAMPFQLGSSLWQNMNTQAAQDMQSIGNYMGGQGSFQPNAYQGGGQTFQPMGGQAQQPANMNMSGLDMNLMGQMGGAPGAGGTGGGGFSNFLGGISGGMGGI